MSEEERPISEEIQEAVKGVFTRRGEMAGEAVVVVEVIQADGDSYLWVDGGELANWNILGRLKYAELVVGKMARDDE